MLTRDFENLSCKLVSNPMNVYSTTPYITQSCRVELFAETSIRVARCRKKPTMQGSNSRRKSIEAWCVAIVGA
jgi:hypothetical protein